MAPRGLFYVVRLGGAVLVPAGDSVRPHERDKIARHGNATALAVVASAVAHARKRRARYGKLAHRAKQARTREP